MNIVSIKNRLIAFLDVLGFSSLLRCEPLIEVHKKYSQFIDVAKTKTFFCSNGDNEGRTNFEFAQFISDSLVVVSNPVNDIYNVNNFIGAISFLLEQGFVSNLPLRGAITKGNFLIDNNRNIFLSDSLPKVVRFEERQEWSGCTILKNAEEVIIESTFGKCDIDNLKNNQLCNFPIHSYNVPLKKGEEELFVINYMSFLSKEQIVSGIDYLIEPKRSNVQDYFDFLNSLPVETQTLSKEFYPAVQMFAMKTRSGMRFSFLDENNNPCKPGVEKFEILTIGRWKE